MLDWVEGSYELFKIIREDPRIGWALAILLIAGVLAAILIRRFRRQEFLKIPK